MFKHVYIIDIFLFCPALLLFSLPSLSSIKKTRFSNNGAALTDNNVQYIVQNQFYIGEYNFHNRIKITLKKNLDNERQIFHLFRHFSPTNSIFFSAIILPNSAKTNFALTTSCQKSITSR